jgi:hypothetical protein
MKKLILLLILLISPITIGQENFNNNLTNIPQLNKWFYSYQDNIKIENYAVKNNKEGHYSFMTQYDKVMKFFNPILVINQSNYKNIRVENFKEFKIGILQKFYLKNNILIGIMMDKDMFIISIIDLSQISESQIEDYINNLKYK